MRRLLPYVFWLDGLSASIAGVAVLWLRATLAELYALPVVLITFIGAVNVAYSTLGLTLAVRARRSATMIAALAIANGAWAIFCGVLAANVAQRAHALGLAHVLGEGLYVAALGAVEWRNRHALSERSPALR